MFRCLLLPKWILFCTKPCAVYIMYYLFSLIPVIDVCSERRRALCVVRWAFCYSTHDLGIIIRTFTYVFFMYMSRFITLINTDKQITSNMYNLKYVLKRVFKINP